MTLSKEQADLLAGISGELVRANARIAELEAELAAKLGNGTTPGSVATEDLGAEFYSLITQNFGSGPISLIKLMKFGEQVSKFLDGKKDK